LGQPGPEIRIPASLRFDRDHAAAQTDQQMAEDRLKQARYVCGRETLKAQALAAQHILTCPRGQRLFLVAYEAHVEQWEKANPLIGGRPALGLNPAEVWLITKELLREFRQCTDWPKGAF
jgi:predicted urease superfamily metal-dependent hydrolase